ncbi:hypothetical protein DM02DRAFT_616094 [Periconia macrospinosa]|uniref:Uncharacterized protein n=1 Tax=Periconia macrospinosa TaxID=97972 RepID=A0A2V1DIT5_9PLEO|nr:hypothetical protein DM02DRAFT_616094 [Periconia macrospinosa]
MPPLATNEANISGEQPGILERGKRKILSLNQKDAEARALDTTTPPLANINSNNSTMSPTSAPALLPSPPLTTSPRGLSPRGSPRIYPAGIAASPRRVRSSSPGLHSPASSQIFERSVQEPESSPAIPAHIQTEDHIPAALDASSIAITDNHLNPDEVEIIMHSAHQPAAAAVTGSVSESIHSPSLAHEDFASSNNDLSESVSTNPNYGSLDTTDPRRLSFISFADVVQAELAETDRDAIQFMSLSSTVDRSPSPVRSPASSHGFSASPPRSGAASEKGAFARSPSSPTSHSAQSPPVIGDLQIETMRQALRRTGSGDLSGVRSQLLSADEPPPAVLAPVK